MFLTASGRIIVTVSVFNITSLCKGIRKTQVNSQCYIFTLTRVGWRVPCRVLHNVNHIKILSSFHPLFKRNAKQGFYVCIDTSSVQSDSDLQPTRRSGRRSLEVDLDLPLNNAVLQDLLTDIMHHKDSWPFLRPVPRAQVITHFRLFFLAPTSLW